MDAPRSEEPRALGPEQALAVARCQARTVARRIGMAYGDAADDIAAEALLVLVSKKLPLCAPTIHAVVVRVAHRVRARRAASREVLCADAVLAESHELAGQHLLAPALDAEGDVAPARRPGHAPVRWFRDGSRVALPDRCFCAADADALTLTGPGGDVRSGRAALAVAQALLLSERHARRQQAGNAARSVSALSRDALLLQAAGLPWRDALAWLSERGVRVSRQGLRSGQRAARLRCQGRSAHGR